jgi:AraC-like DNA-binding protein
VTDRHIHKALVLGPALEHPCSFQTATGILKRMHLPLKQADELILYFDKIPNLSLSNFLQTLFFLNYIINEELPPIHMQWYQDMTAAVEAKQKTSLEQDKLIHNSRDWDKLLENCVEFGELEELEKLLPRMHTEGAMGSAAESSLRSIKNVAISAIALIARAAARGGMDYEGALTLSDEYIRQVEARDSYDAVIQLLSTVFYDYTAQVARIRRLSGSSRMVHHVVQYVQQHLHEPIQVAQIAQTLGYNPSYLCRSFKEETGKNLKEYINQTKIDEAKYLLRSTNMPILDLSVHLGFSSQAYFTSLFKSLTGTTPVQYRQSST